MITSRVRSCVLLAVLSFPASVASAQVTSAIGTDQVVSRDRIPVQRTGTGSVKGRVLDGTTGAGVARARVVIQGATQSTVMTDASGTFTFANLPPGPITLAVNKSTYLATRYPAPGRTLRSNMRPLMLADGQALDNVTIPMFHGASISGRVLDASGDLVDSAQVNVLRVPASGLAGQPMQRGGTSTDDRGEFRIGRLEAGTYLLHVRANRGPADATIPGAVPQPPTLQPVPTYYPSAAALDQAQPITLEKGQSITDIDIVLADALPGVLTGTVTTTKGAELESSNAYVNARQIISDVGRGYYGGFAYGTTVRPDGSFRLVLAPGEYQLDVNVTPRTIVGPPRPEDEQFGTTKVTVVSGGEQAVAITVGRGAVATGRVIFEGNTPPPASIGKAHVPLFSETGQCRAGEAMISPDWTFKVEGLSGTCLQPPGQMFGRWNVKAVMINGDDVSNAPFTFQPDQQLRNVQVIVTDKRSELVFHVTDDSGQSTPDYVVAVYPVENARWPMFSRYFVGPIVTSITSTQGRPTATNTAIVPSAASTPRRESMSGLRPGDYYVVAVDDMEQEDYRDPVVLEKLRSSAVRVTMADGTVDVSLRRISFATAIATR